MDNLWHFVELKSMRHKHPYRMRWIRIDVKRMRSQENVGKKKILCENRDASMKKPATRRSETRVIVAAIFCCGTRRLPTTLQFHRFHFSDESLVVVGQEPADHVEHGVTEATNFENVSPLTLLWPC
jgi:hypothetical protein